MQEIFVVDDDSGIREMLLYALEASGFKARGFEDAETLLQALRTDVPALVLLDIMLPGKDGIEGLQWIRKTPGTKALPLILITAKGSELDRITGLDRGADDYITKPFSILEVVARVKALLRRVPEEAGTQELVIGELRLNPLKRSLHIEEQEVTLTFKEFELLHTLMLNQGIVLSRERLLDEIWGVDYTGESRTVDMHIKSLRQKLGKAGERIKTLRSVGYCLRG